MRHEVFFTMTGPELKQLDMGAPRNLKQIPEIKFDTDQEMAAGVLKRRNLSGLVCKHSTFLLYDTF